MFDRRTLAGLIAILWACSATPARNAGSPAAAASAARTTNATNVPCPDRTAPKGGAALGGKAAAPSVLRVGTSGDYAPFSTREASGKTIGFDIELAEQMASDLGVELQWVPFRWPELADQLAAGAFDVAMGGVTWQPARAVSGYMTRTVGRGGPCVLGVETARRIAVNRGGVLEKWARGRFGDRELVTVDDNQSLPALLADGRVGAIVTDSFERKSFERPGWAARCEPARSQKVYWVGSASARARELGERLDAWLRSNPARVQAAQERWFGERQRLDATAHLVDLLARRFAFMPLVSALKVASNLPIEDLPREREVLAAVAATAQRKGLPEHPVKALFALQIELSKAVQRRQTEGSALDLTSQIRPALNELGDRILDALLEARASDGSRMLGPDDLEPLAAWLSANERAQLLAAVRAALTADAGHRTETSAPVPSGTN